MRARIALVAGILPLGLPLACGRPHAQAPRLHPSSSLLASARFTAIDDDAGALAGSSLKIGALDLRARSAIGDRLPLCVGLDGTIGASSTGMSYGADLYPFGVVLPVPGLGRRRAWASACAGFGLSGVRGSVPFAWEFPAELSAALDLGFVFARVWGRAALVADAEARRDGTEATAGFADEYSAGFDFRLLRFRHLGEREVDSDVFVGLSWSEMMGSTFSGLYLGFGAHPPQPR